MKGFRLAIFGLSMMIITVFYSCDKEDGDNTEHTVVNTTWIYSNEESGGKNIFTFKDETNVSFTQEWVDSGEDKSETKEGTYEYGHPDISITIGSKVYSGTVDETAMTLSGYVYNKQ
jgi:hypothetical protein